MTVHSSGPWTKGFGVCVGANQPPKSGGNISEKTRKHKMVQTRLKKKNSTP